MVLRLQGNWQSGTNRFARPGEVLLGALDGGQLVGICGRNIDPFDPTPRAGRIRHLYIRPDHRLQGIASQLLDAVIEGAERHFDYLNTNAPPGAFVFYEHHGFPRLENVDRVTHRLPCRGS